MQTDLHHVCNVCRHWAPLEQPQAVTAMLLAFIPKPPPKSAEQQLQAAGSADTSAVEAVDGGGRQSMVEGGGTDPAAETIVPGGTAVEAVDGGGTAADTTTETIVPVGSGTRRMSTSLRTSTSRGMSHRVSDAPVAVEG